MNTWAQFGCEWTQSGPQGPPESVTHERHKDVRFDPVLELVKNGAQHQAVLQVPKGRFGGPNTGKH